MNFTRRYTRQFSELARPLTNLTKTNAHFKWCEEAQQAFEILKEKLTQAPILAYPKVQKPYKLYTDTSQYAVGAILTQVDEDRDEHVIQYISHILHAGHMKWPTIE